MNKKVSKRVLQGIETKKNIINCAKELFREKGYNRVSVDEIIKKANSSKGSFYTHFRSKEELLFNMVPLVDEVYLEFLELNLQPDNTIDKISLFINYVFKTIEDKIGLEFISTIYSTQIKDLASDSFLITSDRKYYQVLLELIEEGKMTNEIKQELSSENMVSILTTCIRGVIYDWCLKKGGFSIVEYGEEVTNIVLNQLRI